MKKFKVKSLAMKAMSEIRGGSNITHDTKLLLSRKTKQLVALENETIEIVGTITVDRER